MSPTAPPLGIALSGGGYRSALYATGALDYLAQAGIVRRATTIASLSGGSYVNARLMSLEGGLANADRDELRACLRPMVKGITERPVWLTPNLLRGILRPGAALHNVIWEAILGDLDRTLAGADPLWHVFTAFEVHQGGLVHLTNRGCYSEWPGEWPATELELRSAIAATTAVPVVFSPHPVDVSNAIAIEPIDRLFCTDPGDFGALASAWFTDGDPVASVRPEVANVLVIDGTANFVPEAMPQTMRWPFVRRWAGAFRWMSQHIDSSDAEAIEQIRAADGWAAITSRENPIARLPQDWGGSIPIAPDPWPDVVAANGTIGVVPRRMTEAEAISLIHHGYVSMWAEHNATAWLDEPVPELDARSDLRARWLG